jgi:hypothetical protein
MAITELFFSTGFIATTSAPVSIAQATPSTALSTSTSAGVYQFFLDFNNMIAGEQYEIKAWERVTNTAGIQRLVETWVVDGAQAEPIFVTPALTFMNGWDFTVQRVGTSSTTTSTGNTRHILSSVRQLS